MIKSKLECYSFQGDASCQLEACHFCCVSSEGAEDIEGMPADLLQDAATREVQECQYQCSRHMKPVE